MPSFNDNRAAINTIQFPTDGILKILHKLNPNNASSPDDIPICVLTKYKGEIDHININKCSVLSITLKCYSSFHDHNILGTMPKRASNHDYHGVTISSDLNWFRHAKQI